MQKTVGLRPTPCKLLKKFDQNFILKSCVCTILGFNNKVFVNFFQKVAGCGTESHGFIFIS